MKTIVNLFLFLFLMQFAHAQDKPISIQISKTKLVDGKVCLKNNLPLEGLYKIKYSGRIYEISFFKNGLKQGKSKYFRKGKLEEEGIYCNNLREGEWKYFHYFNGELDVISNYKNGLKEGKETSFSGNKNSIDKVLNYKNGELDGLQINYTYSGDLQSEEWYKNGMRYDTSFYYNYKGELIKKCVFFDTDYGYCIRYDSLITSEKHYSIRDTLYYKNEIPFLLNTYVNDSLFFTLQVSDNLLKIDSLISSRNYISNDTIRLDYSIQKQWVLTILIPIEYMYYVLNLKDIILPVFDKYPISYSNYNKEVYINMDPCKLDYLLVFYEIPYYALYPDGDFYEVRLIPSQMDMIGGCYTELMNTNNTLYFNNKKK